MRTLVYSTHVYDQPLLAAAAQGKHELVFSDKKLTTNTVAMSKGFDCVALFTSDDASEPVLTMLHSNGIRFIALRSVGHDHVDLRKAAELGIRVANVPGYSPYAIAEHAVAMLLTVNRKIVQSRLLMQLQDFRLDSLTGFDIHGKTVGIIGTGKIGMAFASIMMGFGASLLGYDPVENPDAVMVELKYVSLESLLKSSDIISLHCPLNDSTHRLLAAPQFNLMKKNSILINTARGGVIQTEDLVTALEKGSIGAACLDVYEKEKGLFFEDNTQTILKDPLYARLSGLKNVLITGHQGFLTHEALDGIARTTIENLDNWEQYNRSPNEVTEAQAPVIA